MSNCFWPAPPVALTGKRIGQVMQQPTKQTMTAILRYRRRKYPSMELCFKTYVSGNWNEHQSSPARIGRELVLTDLIHLWNPTEKAIGQRRGPLLRAQGVQGRSRSILSLLSTTQDQEQ